jgi:hypothetical protein
LMNGTYLVLFHTLYCNSLTRRDPTCTSR